MNATNLSRPTAPQKTQPMEMWAWHEAAQVGAINNDVLQQEWSLVYESIQRVL